MSALERLRALQQDISALKTSSNAAHAQSEREAAQRVKALHDAGAVAIPQIVAPCLAVCFPGNSLPIVCRIDWLSLDRPCRGYRLGDYVMYGGPSGTFAGGNRVVHGQWGEVVAPEWGPDFTPFPLALPCSR